MKQQRRNTKEKFFKFFRLYSVLFCYYCNYNYKRSQRKYSNKIPCRLINPSKSSIGKISKVILEKIDNHIQKENSANQWKDTSSVIEWFVNIKEKEPSFFMVFDIESFYPSITERLFNNAIQFAKQITEISDYDMSLINQSRKTLLFNENCLMD